MKGSYFLGADSTPKFEIRDMRFDQLGPEDVLVKVHACGVCGTDVHIYHGEEGSAPVTPPVVLGHEFSGVVEKIGSQVTLCSVGDHVTLDPNMYCGKCRPCREGKKQNCEHLFALGVNTDGGFAQYCVAPQAQCYRVLPQVDLDVAAMAEPLACAIHGIDNAKIRLGQNVLVVGGGAIGLLMVQLAKLSGAAKVLLSEPVALRRRLGLEVGADGVIDPVNESISEAVKAICGTDGVDVVIECVGNTKAVAQAIEAAGLGATILLFSVPSVGATVDLPLMDVFKKELHITGSIINPDTHQRAVDMINSGRLEIKKLITHVFDIEHLEDAIKCQMGSESIKVIVRP
ncbi:MAG: zinc-dependent alcohol dehydrogenase family protein [Clostridia bacterium]|nr:zinc-dependent alcohol dehydrogenase family protein [Clostridia bacterium]